MTIVKLYDVTELEIGGRNLITGSNFIHSYTNTSPVQTASLGLPSGFDLQTLKNKKIILSYYVSNIGDWVEGTNSYPTRFGFHGSITYENTSTGSTTTYYPFAEYLDTKGLNGRIFMEYTVTLPKGYDKIKSFGFSYQPMARPSANNNNVWKIGQPKLEIGT